MAKSTKTYFNPLKSDHRGDWEDVDGSRGAVRQLTLAVDPDNGDYTRLTRFIGKVDTSYTERSGTITRRRYSSCRDASMT